MRINISITIEVDIEKLGKAREWAFKHNAVFASKGKVKGTYEVTLTAHQLRPHEVDPFIQICREFSIPFDVNSPA